MYAPIYSWHAGTFCTAVGRKPSHFATDFCRYRRAHYGAWPEAPDLAAQVEAGTTRSVTLA